MLAAEQLFRQQQLDKFIMLLLLAMGTLAQNVDQEIECNFVQIEDEYFCLLYEIEVTDPNANVILTGEHLENRNDDDVSALQIQRSTTPFLIPQIFTTFRNLRTLLVSYSGLESLIRFPDTVQLHNILLIGNNITRIEDNTFETQSELRILQLTLNEIEEVQEDAFVGLESLEVLAILYNRIANLPDRTLHPLINAVAIDLRGNQIERIQEELFAQNSNLETLLLEGNRISAISPRFLQQARRSLHTLHLFQNVCIDRSFVLESDAVWSFLTAALSDCFNNWTGANREDVRETRLTYGGRMRMRINDGFGNLVFS